MSIPIHASIEMTSKESYMQIQYSIELSTKSFMNLGRELWEM